MIKAKIDNLITMLEQARQQGCSMVKLQLYESWEEVKKELDSPSKKPEEYLVDVRCFNTIEFDTHIQDKKETDQIRTLIDGDTLIIRTTLTDWDSLRQGLGIASYYE